MKKYYIIRSDGTSVFSQAYSEDFIFHCLVKLLDSSEEKFYLLREINFPSTVRCVLERRREEEVLYQLLRSEYT